MCVPGSSAGVDRRTVHCRSLRRRETQVTNWRCCVSYVGKVVEVSRVLRRVSALYQKVESLRTLNPAARYTSYPRSTSGSVEFCAKTAPKRAAAVSSDNILLRRIEDIDDLEI